MKKKVVMLLVAILLLTLGTAMAGNTRTSGLYTYEIRGNGTITITGFNWARNAGKDIFIPTMIDGYLVTAIGDEAFLYEPPESSPWKINTPVSVTLPEGIKIIGNKAFWFANIKSINIPNSVQMIGAAAFVKCMDCQFIISQQHSTFAVIGKNLYEKAEKKLIAYCGSAIPEGIASIGDYACAWSPRGITLPTTLTHIGDYAFYHMHNALLSEMGLESTRIKSIGAYAFSGFVWKKFGNQYYMGGDPIRLPETLEELGEGAFSDIEIQILGLYYTYENVPWIIIPENAPIRSIPDYAFRNFKKPIQIEAPITSVGTETGINTGLVHPEAVTVISRNPECGQSFQSADDLSPLVTTIVTGFFPWLNELPETVTAIETGAFGVEKDFKLPHSIESIAVDGFAEGSTFIVDAGSYAELWCSENGFGYTVEGQEDDLSWLNN